MKNWLHHLNSIKSANLGTKLQNKNFPANYIGRPYNQLYHKLEQKNACLIPNKLKSVFELTPMSALFCAVHNLHLS